MSRLIIALSLLSATFSASAGINIERWQTSSGAQVHYVAARTLPMLDVEVDFPAGSAADPAGKAGLAELVRSTMELGAGDLDENAVTTRLADVGAQLGGGVDRDRASFTLRTLAAPEKRDPALAVLHAILSAPRFANEVFERERARSAAALSEALTRPETLARRAFWSALYGKHPYGQQADAASLQRIVRPDLAAFHQARYAAKNAFISIVGDIDRPAAAALAERLSSGLPNGTANDATNGTALPALAAPPLPQASEQRLAHPAAQAHIHLGLPALQRGDADFYALALGNYTLGGGGFVSRLMQEVREKRGLAYSVSSYFMPLKAAGPFGISLQTRREQANEALAIARRELEKFLATGPSEVELAAAKANLIGSFPLNLDSNRKILSNLALIAFYGLPLDYLDTYATKMAQVSVDDVRAAFARHVRVENLVTVVVAGD